MTTAQRVQLAYDFLQTGPHEVLVARTEKGLAAVMLADSQHTLSHALGKRFPPATHQLMPQDLATDKARLNAVIQGEITLDKSSLDMQGTTFQMRVWQKLMTIPYGTTISYQQLAEHVGSPSAIRAVATACGANPLAIVVPCHRVIRKNGELGGYYWGLQTKRYLLTLEQTIKHRRQTMSAMSA